MSPGPFRSFYLLFNTLELLVRNSLSKDDSTWSKRFINWTQQLKVVTDLEPTLFQILFLLIVLKKHLRKYTQPVLKFALDLFIQKKVYYEKTLDLFLPFLEYITFKYSNKKKSDNIHNQNIIPTKLSLKSFSPLEMCKLV